MSAYCDAFGAPRVEIEVEGSRGTVQVSALLDSGFDGDVSLPIGVAIQLGLELQDVITVELADGSLSDELVFAGYLLDQGQERRVSVLLTRSEEALLGLGLLRGCRVILDFGTGAAEITPSQG